MSLKLLVDEDSQSRRLVRLLREAGHDVLTANEAGLQGAVDPAVLERAWAEDRILLTSNVHDFRLLHEENLDHRSILAICHDSDPAKDMSHAEIVAAIGNLEAAGIDLAGSFHVLNAWRW